MNKLFSEVEVGAKIIYKGDIVVKITQSYFVIHPYKNGAQSRMVNAMIEKTGKLLKIDHCLCVSYS